MGIHRSAIRRRRREDAADTRSRNMVRKHAERSRRHERMVEMIRKNGDLPYSPAVMSWLSRQVGKPASKITQQEVKEVTG